MNIQQVAVQAGKRAIGPKWGFEIAQPMKAMHGVDVEREIMRQLKPITGPMEYNRGDDEGCGILRRLFG